MKILLASIVGVLFITNIASADAAVSFDIQGASPGKKVKELRFVTPKGMHFNTEAPNKVEVKVTDASWLRADKIEINKTEAKAQWSEKFDICQQVRAQLFVCDDKNTFCLPHALRFSCDGKKLVSGDDSIPEAVAQEGVTGTTATASAMAAKGAEPKDGEGFIVNDPNKALNLAQEQHKPMLIDFYGVWCPPCNVLDETVFNSAEFKKIRDSFVLLKLDADSPTSWGLKSKFNVTGYPTIVFATSSGDEISRIIGSRDRASFVASMNAALKDKEGSLDAKKDLADNNGNVKAAYEVGLISLDRGDYTTAHYYLYKASRSWNLADIKRNDLLSAELGLHAKAESTEDRKIYERFLESALEWYPHQLQVFDRASELARVAKEMGDTDVIHEALNIQVSNAEWFLKHPKAIKNTEWSAGDLYELVGQAYEDMGQGDDAKKAFEAGADEYLKAIKASGQDENKERGNNLERIYCLWKSGKIEVAETLYTKFEGLYPEEFTYYYQHAHMLNDLKKYKDAEARAQLALKYSYGDNKLRVLGLLAEIYAGQGENKKVLSLLDPVIKNYELPEDKNIRTHRYFEKLVALQKKASKS